MLLKLIAFLKQDFFLITICNIGLSPQEISKRTKKVSLQKKVGYHTSIFRHQR
jgi:hypothetical protein